MKISVFTIKGSHSVVSKQRNKVDKQQMKQAERYKRKCPYQSGNSGRGV